MRNSGFTLIELSIVVLFIAAITSSIVVGRSLMHQAQIRAVANQVKGFQTAIYAFKLQYHSLPGDFPQATQYWDDTEDGNGNSIIEEVGWSPGNEGTRAWQHLVLAEILPGGYQGVGTQKEGANIPASKLDGGGFYFRSRPKDLLHSGIDKPFIEWGGCQEENVQECHGGIITPDEAAMLDRKMDDGYATTGAVFGYHGYPENQYPHCSGSWTSPKGSVDYQFGQKDKDCRMDFWLGL